jgi:DNA-directed RNA polymerase alpha subunit
MRCIDIFAFLESEEKHFGTSLHCLMVGRPGSPSEYPFFESLRERLLQQPVVTYEDLVSHSRWLPDDSCARCREIDHRRSKFCPECGAKMDGEEIAEEFEARLKKALLAEARERSIETLSLSVRSYNILRRAGCKTVGDIIDKTTVQLMNMRGMGKHSLNEIMDKLEGIELEIKGAL